MTGVARRGPALAAGLLLAAALGGCDATVEPPAPAAPAPASAPGYARELAALGAGIERGLALSRERPDDGLLPLEVFGLYLERARLAGDYEDYRRAGALLDALDRSGKPPAALCLARARLHYTLHRLAQARTTLAGCPPGADPAERDALQADIDLYSGRYREAEAAYRALVNAIGAPQHYARLAQFRARTGSPGEAAALLEAAEKRYHGGSATMKAWLRLQRGLVALERGRPDEAIALYRLAGDALPGWWLVDEHIAEALRLRGDTSGAKALYESVVERTGAPEFLDALATIERDAGRADEADRLRAQARALHERRLAAFPEAAAGHALDHYLEDARDARMALQLAQRNYASRPNGDAAVALARAWLRSGEPARALALLQAQRQAGWDTPELRWVLAESLARAGRHAQAGRERAAALERNPLAEAMYALPD